MDTSEQYVDMCDKVPREMKDLFHGQIDFYLFIEYQNSQGVFLWGTCCEYKNIAYVIPLFRQDQLQDMLKRDEDNQVVWELNNLWDEIREGPAGEGWFNSYYQQLTSFEQLWLAFVMKEKYDKIWNGKDWEEKC